ncbi:MAG TPA: type II toxin-antitoxin system PemK/MazF family toxin [Gammaproteobacteria bacterium]|nr:type II toxin-antitoxin system PemK/MazF family toxin [Gammaproteobacteria bacterium]
MTFAPKRWHIYIVDLEPRVGSKPGKQRPCLVIQPIEFAESGLKSTVVLPLTSKIIDGNAFPLRIRVPQGTVGLTDASDILIDQILAWDNCLFRQELGILPENLIEEVKSALKDFLDL